MSVEFVIISGFRIKVWELKLGNQYLGESHIADIMNILKLVGTYFAGEFLV
jgi:hypothetical protein